MALKEMSGLENPDRKYAMVTELKTLRKYVDSIPDRLKKEIDDSVKKEKSEKILQREKAR